MSSAPDSPPAAAPLAPGTVVKRPRPNDVLGTRSRKDQNSHPGNIFYWKMIMHANNNNSDSGKAAAKIYDIVTKDRKGQFLRKDVDSRSYVVLDKQLAITKIRSSLNYVSRGHTKRRPEDGGEDGDDDDDEAAIAMSTSPAAAPIRKKRKRRTGTQTYVVVMNKSTENSSGASPTLLLPYALDLIAKVCNQPNPSAAIRLLAQTTITGEEETPPQRSLRLQLRQRYSGAIRQGISHIAFSRKLLVEWGATLERQSGDPEEQQAAACVTEESQQQQEQESAGNHDDDDDDDDNDGGDEDILDAPTPKVRNGQSRTTRLRISEAESSQKEAETEEQKEDSKSATKNKREGGEEDDAGSSDSEFSFGSPPSPEKKGARKSSARSSNKEPRKVSRASRKLSKATEALDPIVSPRNWDEWCDRLVDFHRKHGHADVPAGHHPPEQKKLYDWLRSQKKRRKLSREQKGRLHQLGVEI